MTRSDIRLRSGLFNYSMDPDFFKALTSDPRRPFAPQELPAYFFRHPVQFQPGEKFEYSNTNVILLGIVVEKAGGLPLAEYLERNVFEPVGMHPTFLPRGTEFPAPHAHGRTDQTASGRTQNATDWDPSWAWAAGEPSPTSATCASGPGSSPPARCSPPDNPCACVPHNAK